jgi:uncharacterized protein YutE (UPF0331/DUF86 family)
VTDPDLLSKKLAEIETYLAELASLARPEAIATDLRERRFVEHTLQLAIQCCLDVSSHIVADERLGEPESYAELFSLLASRGYLSAELAPRLRRMAGFRNLLVHNYARVDPQIVEAVLRHDVNDLREFVSALRQRLGG